MTTECNPEPLEFHALGRREVIGRFDDGRITSDGGGLLLREVDKRLGLRDRLATCFTNYRNPNSLEHSVQALVAQRVYGLALGYEDLNDRDVLRKDSVLALLVDVFLESHQKPPREIWLDLDATDDPLHGHQEGRFFHGYYRCYCYLPLYIFCGEHLLCARLRSSNQDAAAGSVDELERIVTQIRQRWPKTRIVIRGDAGFCREAIMAWYEANDVRYVLGLARNKRLQRALGKEMEEARAAHERSGRPARRLRDFRYRTRKSWSRERRVIGILSGA